MYMELAQWKWNGETDWERKSKDKIAKSHLILFHSENPHLRSLQGSVHINSLPLRKELFYFNFRNICRNQSVSDFYGAFRQYPWEFNMPFPMNSTFRNLPYSYVCSCTQRIMYAQWYSLLLSVKEWKEVISLLKGPVK